MIMDTLVDSGAARSMLKESRWKEICAKTNQPPVLKEGLQLRSLSGHPLPTKGVATVNVLGKPVDFYVTPTMSHDLLLGIDALNTLEMTLHCAENDSEKRICLGGYKFKWGSIEQEVAGVEGVHVEIDYWMQQFPDLF